MTLDGDAMRAGLCADLGFSREDRAENVRRVAEVAALLAHAGIICIAALISPFAADRATARRIVTRRAGVSFVEVFVDAPLDCCRDRDPKGLYRDARLGKVSRLTGVSDPYEAPVSPELQVRTDVMSVDACADLVCARVVQLFV
jgi:adenylyl-sulfate kinase